MVGVEAEPQGSTETNQATEEGCVIPNFDLSLYDFSPFAETLRRWPATFEFTGSTLAGLLAGAQTKGGPLEILASQADRVYLSGRTGAEEVHVLWRSDILTRLAAISAEETVIAPAVRIADGARGYVEAIGFDQAGRQRSIDGCAPEGYFDVIPRWRDERHPTWSDLEAWRAVLTVPSTDASDFDSWSARLLAGLQQEVGWDDLPPDNRQLNPEDTPSAVLDTLESGLVAIDLAGRWDGVDGIVCLRIELAWGECVPADADKALIDGWHEPGGGMEVWLLESDRLGSSVVRLAEIGSGLVAGLEQRATDGAEQVLSITAAVPAESITDVVQAVNSGQEVLSVELVTLDELERTYAPPSSPDNPDGS